MGKKRKLIHAPTKSAGRPKKPLLHKPDVSKKVGGNGSGVQKKNKPQREEAPTIPFESYNRILLIGEGDLSFATSLVEHHDCVNVTATVLEKDEEELLNKYPHAKRNIAIIRGEPFDDNEEAQQSQDGSEDEEWEGIEDNDDEAEEQHGNEKADGKDQDQDQDASIGDEQDEPDYDDDDYDEHNSKPKHNLSRKNRLIFNIDATKLPTSLTRTPYTHIIFNFPHVGGKSTDINRQVRHNQSLLVSFFQRALPGLAPGGSIIVTLFEGEPYTLWNIRDLGRHAGLAVERSFRFQARAYPGYHHARTLGVVRNKKGEHGGGWKGEERAARSYVFRRKGDVEGGRKRKKGDDSSDEED